MKRIIPPMKYSFCINIVENDVDGDAFVMLNDEVIKELIPAVGTRLKFQSVFARLSPRLKEHEASDPITSKDDDDEGVSATKTSATNLKITNDEFIREHANIFGLHRKDAQLSNWQKAVNASAYEAAKTNPDLLNDRGTLKFEAQKKAREGYIFQKKGGSRSKDMTGSELTIKRTKISQEERGDRSHEISQELEMLRKQIMMKQQIIAKSSTMKDYQQYDQAQMEMRELVREGQA